MDLGVTADLRKADNSSTVALCRPNPVGAHTLSSPLQHHCGLRGFQSACLSQINARTDIQSAFLCGHEKYHVCISGVFFACREAELVMYSAIY